MKLPRVAHIGWLSSAHLRRRAGELAQRGMFTVVFTDNIPESVDRNSLPYRTEILPRDLLPRPMQLVKWIEQRLFELNVDLLHIHSTHFPAALGFFVRTIPRLTSIWDFVFSKDSVSPLYHRVFLNDLMSGDLSEAISFSSPVLHQQWLSRGYPESRAFLHSWGVDSRIFHIPPPDAVIERLRQQLGIPPGQKIIFSPRTPSLPANVDLILQAVERNKQLHCIVAGHAFPPEARYLERLARRKGVSERVRFIGTIQSQKALYNHYIMADIVISLHSNDHNPATVLEAMASESLVIINESNTVGYWIKDGENGLVAHTRNLEHLSQKINEALMMPQETVSQWGKLNRETITSKANFSKTVTDLLEDYCAIAKMPQPPPCSLFHRGLLFDLCQRHREALECYRKAAHHKGGRKFLKLLAQEKEELLSGHCAAKSFHMRTANPLVLRLAREPRKSWARLLQDLPYPKHLYRHDIIAGFFPLMEEGRLKDILLLTELFAQRFHTDTLEWLAECINWFGNRWKMQEKCAELLMHVDHGGTSLGIHALETAKSLGEGRGYYRELLEKAAAWTSESISFINPELDRKFRKDVHCESTRLLSFSGQRAQLRTRST